MKIFTMKPKHWLCGILVLTVVGVIFISGCIRLERIDSGTQNKLELEPEKERTHLSKVSDTKNAYWIRSGGIFWGQVEPARGKIDWKASDGIFQKLQSENTYMLFIVFPYANWDQETCHLDKKYDATFGSEKIKVGKPCNMTAYKEFLGKLVERYDGDGKEDMPGLKVPVKYWEIMNEPEMQGGAIGGMGEELKFFVGTPEEYFEILKASYETIKETDPEAKVLHAGMAGMEQNFQSFWDPVFSLEAGKYFDIANIHTIGTDEKREDLFVIKFKNFLKKHNLAEKPIWITEVQFGRLLEKPSDVERFNVLLVRSSVFALALGADKLFYVENWFFWQDQKDEGGSTQRAYSNLVDKINFFESVEKIKEEYRENRDDRDGATSFVGQYKFVFKDKVVYVFWGKAELPSEISGRVKVTDLYGQSQVIDADDIVLGESPIFVEK